MTGQVKELILSRWLELGLEVDTGTISWNPGLIPLEQLCGERKASGECWFSFGAIRFLICPSTGEPHTEVTDANNQTHRYKGWQLSPQDSRHVFARSQQIRKVRFGGKIIPATEF